MDKTTYAIDDGNGNQLTAGLPAHTAHRTAQRMADERNESVYLYAIGSKNTCSHGHVRDGLCLDCDEHCSCEDGEIGEVDTNACPLHGSVDNTDAKEIAPSEIEVELDSHNGPRVTYGAHSLETVEAEIPEGYEADWSNAVETSVSGTHRMRYVAPLVPDGKVTVETMPEWLRESHRTAGNWGVYPANGAVRERVTREEADEIVAADADGYARIVE